MPCTEKGVGMDTSRSAEFFRRMLGESPRAYAHVHGGENYPALTGMVLFFRAEGGSVVFSEFINLPATEGECRPDFFGFHIHEGDSCTGNTEDEFSDAGMHFNPGQCGHPAHLGDLPPLMGGSDGYAWMVFYTDKFMPEDVRGRTVIVHRQPDDFKTQPSGDSGEKIACGEIH